MEIFNWANKVLASVLKTIIVQDSLTFIVPTSIRNTLSTFVYLSL